MIWGCGGGLQGVVMAVEGGVSVVFFITLSAARAGITCVYIH